MAARVWLGYKGKGQVNHVRECQYKHCFNPNHLYIGTQAQNMADRDSQIFVGFEKVLETLMTNTKNRLLKPSEVALICGVSKRTVVRWIHEKRLRGVKVGRVWRVHKHDLERYVRGRL